MTQRLLDRLKSQRLQIEQLQQERDQARAALAEVERILERLGTPGQKMKAIELVIYGPVEPWSVGERPR